MVFFVLMVFLVSVQAIAVVLPTIYVATLSIAGFLANALLGFAFWLALSGVTQKKFLGKKFFEVSAFFLGFIGKLGVGLIAMALAVWWIHPIEIQGILLAGALSGIGTFALLTVFGFRRLELYSKDQKKEFYRSAARFSVLVLVLASAALFFAVRIEELVIADSQLKSQPATLPFWDSSTAASKASGAPLAGENPGQSVSPLNPKTPLDEPSGVSPVQRSQTFIFFPVSGKSCIVSDGEKELAWQPRFDCLISENGFLKRIFCPVIFETSQPTVVAEGSCSLENAAVVS